MEKLPLGLALDLRKVVPYETGSWRTLMPVNIMQTPPCNQDCPAGNDIRGFLRTLAEKKDYEAAWHVLTRTNPLPAICGRVCPHPCEDGCNRRDFDSPVAINSAERAVGDYGLEENLEHKKLIAHRKEKVAVIGSGPAGLSCAFHLAKRGFQVKIFEAYGEPGGMMRYGIPSYRLPNYVLRQELENIWKLGIELECNIKVGVNIPMDQLIQTHDAVFVGIGAQTGLTIDIPGQDAGNVFSGVEFLRDVNSGKYVDVGKDVVVIGGGNTAMDCARVAKRLGANVSVVYRRTRVEMPAITAEIDEAMEERVMFRYHTNPVKIIQDDDKVVGILSVQMELKEPDASGRARPVPIPGSESVIPADTVILATGQAVDYDGIEVHKRDNKWISANENLMTSIDGVFAGGDAVLGLETVSAAIGQGTRAASAIEDYIDGGVESRLSSPPVIYSKDLNTYYYNKKRRFQKEALPIHMRLKHFKELYPALDFEAIIDEAERCFSCGLCFNCGNCFMYCPDNAVRISEKTGLYEFDLDFCKGCGLCAKECPCRYIQMTLEK
ncbi:MAG: NAD(P)-binding protein [Deltaproteobacteria bacterium]|jgi:NADPH-dependent glutamate synthase beta subunit-like oxidoreductase|nr:NAD(P)-binding protein [Deltaproteobacteria bacterium]PNV85681.1 MAG: glutamate synthase [Desulfobacteraceae bacterium]MDH3773356.1 NAD(P)-binding protein [Deltaproteobacteria bacterium]MDH3800966.1 NAD(P)-binding protein [Deltaproteobacteria bacterium]MDH3850537.1 NAD(P)-binding protein [Deltaproteobacteria bacterium]